MKLSTAIRKGMRGTKQAFGEYGGHGSCCALGAANIALTGNATGLVLTCDTVYTHEDQALDVNLPCPACGIDCSELASDPDNDEMGTISHLNDTHRWSRTRIANWLREQGL